MILLSKKFILLALRVQVFLIFCAGLALLGYTLMLSYTIHRSAKWPTTQGEILSNGIQYIYTVNQTTYTSSRQTFIPSPFMREITQPNPLVVYYQKNSPEISTLSTRLSPILLIPLMMGIFFTLFGAILLLRLSPY